MTRHILTGPDGQEYYTDGPEGSTREQALKMAPQLFKAGKMHPVEDVGPKLEDRDPKFDPNWGSLGKAATALPGSVAQVGSDLWYVVTHLDDVSAAVKEKGIKGVFSDIWQDIKDHYGTLGRAQKTFEEDPARFLLDVSSVAPTGVGLAAKVVQGTAKVAGKVLPEVVARTAGMAPEVMRTAREAGRLGPRTLEGAEFKAGVKGQPSPMAAASSTGAGAASVLQAQQRVAPFGQAGRALRTAGFMPDLSDPKVLAKLGAGYVGGVPWWASPALSPRGMGATMYGLGATERGASKVPLTVTRTQLQTAAVEMLRDKEAKDKLSGDEIKTLRKATRDSAPSDTLVAASNIMRRVAPTTFGAGGGPRPPMTLSPEEPGRPQYGGTGAEQSTGGARAVATPPVPPTPGPGEASKPAEQLAPELTGETPLTAPGSPGLARSPTSGAELPRVGTGLRTIGAAMKDPDFWQFYWDQTLKGETLPGKIGESVKSGATLPHDVMTGEVDPTTPEGMKRVHDMMSLMLGGGIPMAERGALGAAGGRIGAEAIGGMRGLAEHLTAEELATVTSRNVESLKAAFKLMPSADEMAAVAYSGRAKRGWYKQSAKALIDTFGNDDAPRFASLLAALSPQTSVESNTENALRTWLNWTRAGRPTDEAGIRKILGQSVQGSKGEGSVLDAWVGNSIRALQATDPTKVQLSGPKVNSFMLNLRNHVHEVTNDAWMARYARVKQEEFASAYRKDPTAPGGKTGFKSPGYLAMSAASRRAAATLSKLTGDTWTPAEIQETIWSWAKTLREKATSAEHSTTVSELLRAGKITHAEIADTPDFALLFTRGVYRNILEEAGYGATIAKIERELGRTAQRRGARPTGSPTRAEGGPFTEAAYRRHLQRAARRLDAPVE